MKKSLSFIALFTLSLGIMANSAHAEELVQPLEEEIVTQSGFTISMTLSHQELINGNTVARWNFTWSHAPSPYRGYFSYDKGQPYVLIQSIAPGHTSGSHSYDYSGKGPNYYYPSVLVSNGYNDPAHGNATVYKAP